MRTTLECLPCFLRQAREAAKAADSDPTLDLAISREVTETLRKTDFLQSPPAMGQQIHQIVRTMTNSADPYRSIKRRLNELAEGLYQRFLYEVILANDPSEAAVRLAIAAGEFDCRAQTGISERQICKVLKEALEEPLVGSVGALFKAAASATRILYLTDKTGEIVFDRLLIERLPMAKLTLGVRGAPTLNDATMADAESVGLTALVETMSNGSDVPGTILEDCSARFRRRFEESDIVIAKGQENYESLSGVNKRIFFLLRAECPVVARHIGCAQGSLLVHYKAPRESEADNKTSGSLHPRLGGKTPVLHASSR